MNTCARCNKKLGFSDNRFGFDIVSYDNALQAGLFSEFRDKKICNSCKRELLESKGIKYKGALGIYRGSKRINELCSELNATQNGSNPVSMLPHEIGSVILWQKDEVYVDNIKCKEFIENKTVAFGANIVRNGFLVVTNQRILFTCKLGFMSKTYGITYGINLEDIMSVSAGKVGFNDKLVILDKNSQHRDYVQPSINSFSPKINSAISKRKEHLHSQKEKERVHIVLDFSSLKETMFKGGIIMSTYNCPKCNGTVEIPEAGKVIFCQYCNTPIKPIDIFERIKSFIQ